MKAAIALAVVLSGTPALAQSRIITNADLGKHLAPIDTVKAETLRGLAARQFVLPRTFSGPTVTILPVGDGARTTIPWEDTYAGRRAIEQAQYREFGQAEYWAAQRRPTIVIQQTPNPGR